MLLGSMPIRHRMQPVAAEQPAQNQDAEDTPSSLQEPPSDACCQWKLQWRELREHLMKSCKG